jgi:MurNAc alpha-1-phosphate uridylyltransferase
VTPPRFSIVPLLRAAIARGEIGWRHHAGTWTDVGTPARLTELNAGLGM